MENTHNKDNATVCDLCGNLACPVCKCCSYKYEPDESCCGFGSSCCGVADEIVINTKETN